MAKMILRSILFIALLVFRALGDESDSATQSDSVTLLLNTHSYVRMEGQDSVIECRFTFNTSRIPQYFVDINRKTQTVTVTMTHVRCGGFAIPDSLEKVNIGPVKSVLLHEDFQNANQGIKGMLPELYEVTIANIKCSPTVIQAGLEARDAARSIYIDFRWPADKNKRKLLYEAPQSGHRGLIASIAAAGAAGIAVGGYFYWKSHKKKTTDPDLTPVLPDHPAVE